MIRYPFLNLADANAPYLDQINRAVERVIASGQYIGGQEVEQFERTLAAHARVDHAVGVSNGLDALRLIFKALIVNGHLAPGDQVIVPANTYIASILAIIDAGLAPVMAEPSLPTLNLDTARLDEYLTPRTRAILTVHLYGRVCYDTALKEFAEHHSLIVVEDNAQAIGAIAGIAGESGHTVTGGLGHAAAYSFYPTKNIGALGDAGAVTTGDPQLADTVRALANYGSNRRYHNIYLGYNCRLDPIQAAVLNVKLPAIDAENERRLLLADIYSRTITNPSVSLPSLPAKGRHAMHQYVILTDNRDEARHQLNAAGIATDIHYPLAPHHQPALESMPLPPDYPTTNRATTYSQLYLPLADDIARRCISLPISRSTSPDDAREIAFAINNLSV